MKSVFHVITTISRGGAENQLLVLVKEQILQGLDVHVVYLKGEPELLNDFQKIGSIVHSNLADQSPFRLPFLLKGLLEKENNIVHAHLPRAELVALLTPARFKLIVSRHNAEPFFPSAPRIFSNFLSRVITLRCKKVIAISKAVERYLTERGEVSNQRKIIVVRYGYQPIAKSSKGDKIEIGYPLKIGTISRLTDQKDLPTMFKVVDEVLRLGHQVTLDVVGEGPLRNKLLRLIKDLELEKYISLKGRTDKVHEFLDGLDVFLLTSRYEGFGLVLLEAIDAGIPIVASRNSAIPEVLGTDFPGLCETESYSDFAEKIIRLLNPDFRQLVLQHQEKRLPLFDASKMGEKIKSIYFE